MRHVQQTLKYESRPDDIAQLAAAIDHLGKKDILSALEVLMAFRERLIAAQTPQVVDYDPREDYLRSMQHGARP